MIWQRGDRLVVEVGGTMYGIEPIRRELGLSRVEMVDAHLAELTRAHRGHGPDVDALLDARAQFARPEFVATE